MVLTILDNEPIIHGRRRGSSELLFSKDILREEGFTYATKAHADLDDLKDTVVRDGLTCKSFLEHVDGYIGLETS